MDFPYCFRRQAGNRSIDESRFRHRRPEASADFNTDVESGFIEHRLARDNWNCRPHRPRPEWQLHSEQLIERLSGPFEVTMPA